MSYNETLLERMRPYLEIRPAVSEKKMFGGIGFLVNGNMCCGIWQDLLVIRLSKEDANEALDQPHIRPMDITGKPMRGWIFVEPAGYKDPDDLVSWIERAYAFAASLPPKSK